MGMAIEDLHKRRRKYLALGGVGVALASALYGGSVGGAGGQRDLVAHCIQVWSDSTVMPRSDVRPYCECTERLRNDAAWQARKPAAGDRHLYFGLEHDECMIEIGMQDRRPEQTPISIDGKS